MKYGYTLEDTTLVSVRVSLETLRRLQTVLGEVLSGEHTMPVYRVEALRDMLVEIESHALSSIAYEVESRQKLLAAKSKSKS